MSRRCALDELATRCASVADEGTDPRALAYVLAWAVRPRRGLESLRRRCLEGRIEGPLAPAQRLARAARGGVDADDARLAVPLVAAWEQHDCRIALVGDPGYPDRLAEGWPQLDAPAWLARRGAPLPRVPTVAIVGARRASGYGVAVAAWLAEAASRAGARIVSGGAVGIDAAAHRAAMGLRGGTVVVLGCGHAVSYPRNHARPGGLFDDVVGNSGAIVSELLPHEPPRAGPVRARNRIVAALADVVVVVEGSARSGALLTAGAAAERGRTVLAVPGDVRAAGSAAPHRLLHEGVGPCTSPADLLEALDGAHGGPDGPSSRRALDDAATQSDDLAVGSVLPGAVRATLVAAWPRPVRIDDLALASGLPIGSLLAAITRGRVAGELAEDPGGVRLRRAPTP